MTSTDYVRCADVRILTVLTSLCKHHGKLYCFPSLRTIKAQLKTFTGREISERSLCRHLGALERDGWIKRQRRHTTAADGSLELHSTLYVLKTRTLHWLKNLWTSLWIKSGQVSNPLTALAVPEMADTLTTDDHSTTNRPRFARLKSGQTAKPSNI